MNIILTCIDNFQEYILDNINQLIKLQHKNIYVITNSHLFIYYNNNTCQLILVKYIKIV